MELTVRRKASGKPSFAGIVAAKMKRLEDLTTAQAEKIRDLTLELATARAKLMKKGKP